MEKTEEYQWHCSECGNDGSVVTADPVTDIAEKHRQADRFCAKNNGIQYIVVRAESIGIEHCEIRKNYGYLCCAS